MTDEWTDRIKEAGAFAKDVGLPYFMLLVVSGGMLFVVYSVGHAWIAAWSEAEAERNAIQVMRAENESKRADSFVAMAVAVTDGIETSNEANAKILGYIEEVPAEHAVQTQALKTLVEHFIGNEGAVKNEPTEPTPGGT